jgi:hypothetical protein
MTTVGNGECVSCDCIQELLHKIQNGVKAYCRTMRKTIIANYKETIGEEPDDEDIKLEVRRATQEKKPWFRTCTDFMLKGCQKIYSCGPCCSLRTLLRHTLRTNAGHRGTPRRRASTRHATAP